MPAVFPQGNRYSTGVLCDHLCFGPLLFAHRGYHLESPENSLVSFQRALDVGADVLEMDVRMTVDGQIVVVHDADGRRVAENRSEITTLRYEELARWNLRNGQQAQPLRADPVRVPRFVDVLEAFPEVALNVDIKQVEPDPVPDLVRLIVERGAAERVLLTSFSSINIKRVLAVGYPGPVGCSQADVARELFGPEAWSVARRSGQKRRPFWRLANQRAVDPKGAPARPACRRLQVPLSFGALRLDTRAVIERAHRLGHRVDYWVVDDPREAARLLDLGADGIVTDNLPAIAQVFARHVRTSGYRARMPASVASLSSDRRVGSVK